LWSFRRSRLASGLLSGVVRLVIGARFAGATRGRLHLFSRVRDCDLSKFFWFQRRRVGVKTHFCFTGKRFVGRAGWSA
jgi:hypothetical protein